MIYFGVLILILVIRCIQAKLSDVANKRARLIYVEVKSATEHISRTKSKSNLQQLLKETSLQKVLLV